MAKVKFNRNEKHDNIGNIEVKVSKNENPTEKIKGLWERARETHPERPVSENWPEYENLDARPENN